MPGCRLSARGRVHDRRNHRGDAVRWPRHKPRRRDRAPGLARQRRHLPSLV